MNRFLFKHITRPLKNQRGVAALMGVIFGIVIMAAIAFNFLAESRQKQAGAILTYTSTNAFMIAEAGLRYAEKCLQDTEATCPSGVNEQLDWTDVDNSDNIAATAFGGGTFAIYFPGSTDPANATGSPNDKDNIRVISVGTYKGAERSIQRFVQRPCYLALYGATSCLGTSTKNSSFIDPEPEEESESVCQDLVEDLDYTDEFTDTDCDTECDGSDAECPDFDYATHTNSGALTQFYFCKMKIDDDIVTTSEADDTDDKIFIARDFEIKGTGELRLSNDALDPADTDETVITVYKNAKLKDAGEIQVKGALTLNVQGKMDMKDDALLNDTQRVKADVITLVRGNFKIEDDAKYYGAISSDGTIEVKNNGYIEGAIQAQEVKFKNNAKLIFDDTAGENTEGYEECGSSDVSSAWAE
jgi:hypothetical protein